MNKWIIIFSCLFSSIISGLFALPYIASTETGKALIVASINRFISGKISIQSLSLHWFSGQKVNQFTYCDSSGKTLLSFEDFKTDASLFSLLLNKNAYGTTELDTPYVYLTSDDEEKDPSSLDKGNSYKKSFPSFNGDFFVNDGTCVIAVRDSDPIFIQNIHAQLLLSKNSKDRNLLIKANTSQGELSGQLSLEGKFDGKEIFAAAHIDHLPTKALHTFVPMIEATGPELNLQTTIRLNSSGIELDVSIHSQNMHGKIFGKTEGSSFILKDDSFLNIHVPTEAINPWIENPEWNIQDPLDITVYLEEMVLPHSSKQLQTLAFKGNFEIAELNLKKAHLRNVKGSFNSSSLKEGIHFELSSSVDAGFFQVRGSYQKKNYQIEGSFKDISSAIFNAPFWFGDHFSCDFKANSHQYEILHLKTSLLETSPIKLKLESDKIKITSPLSFTYQVVPDLLSLPIKQNTQILGTVEQFSTSLKSLFHPEYTTLDVQWKSPSIVFEQFNLSSVTGHFYTPSSLSHFQINLTADGTTQHELGTYIGENLALNLAVQGSMNKTNGSWSFSFPDLKADVKSGKLQGSLCAKIEDGTFTLKQNAQLNVTLAPHLLATFLGGKNEEFFIKSAVSSSFQIEALSFPVVFDIKKLLVTGYADIPHLYLTDKKLEKEASFDNIRAHFAINLAENLAHFHFNGFSTLSYLSAPHLCYQGSIQASVEAKQLIRNKELNFKKATYKMSIGAEAFPTALIDAAFGDGSGIMPALFGPYLKLDLSTIYCPSKEEDGIFEIKASSEGFDADFVIELADTLKIHRSKPSYLRWELTPKRYHFLQQMIRSVDSSAKTDFILLDKAHLEMIITELTCPTDPIDNLSSFFCQCGLVANVRISPLIMMNQITKEKATIEDFHINVNGKNFTESIHVNLGGQLATTGHKASFSFDGNLEEAWTKQGKFNKQFLSTKGTLKLRELSVPSMCGIIPMEETTRGQFQALLGHQIDATIFFQVCQFSGPITIDIDSKNLKTKVNAQLTNGVLTLNEELRAEILLTEELSATLLQNVSPLLITAATSTTSIRLFIDPQGFVIPIRHFSLRGINVDNAVIDLGKFIVRNGGTMQKLTEFLKAKGVSENGEMEAWFTPIFVTLKDGVAIYKRFDTLLANNVHIASWGRLDLNKNKMRMVMGISPQTMKNAFGITGLTDEYMFQIKMKGPVENVVIDWKSASTRIGLLMARTAGGGAGLLIGKLVDIIQGILGDQSTPAPTTHPFPWSKQAAPRGDEMPHIAKSKKSKSKRHC